MRLVAMSLGVLVLGGMATAQTPPAAAPEAPIVVAAPNAAPAEPPLSGGSIFISPMGQPYHVDGPLSGAETWFRAADADHNGCISVGEMQADADRFFPMLDTNKDGEIGPDEITHYETEMAPEIQVTSSYGDPSLAKTDDDGNVTDPPYPTRLGAGRYGFLDMPEPVVSADVNLDRSISKAEFENAAARRFRMLDTDGTGCITRSELPKLNRQDKRRRGGGAPADEGGHHGHGGMDGMGGAGGDMGGPGGGMGMPGADLAGAPDGVPHNRRVASTDAGIGLVLSAAFLRIAPGSGQRRGEKPDPCRLGPHDRALAVTAHAAADIVARRLPAGRGGMAPDLAPLAAGHTLAHRHLRVEEEHGRAVSREYVGILRGLPPDERSDRRSPKRATRAVTPRP